MTHLREIYARQWLKQIEPLRSLKEGGWQHLAAIAWAPEFDVFVVQER